LIKVPAEAWWQALDGARRKIGVKRTAALIGVHRTHLHRWLRRAEKPYNEDRVRWLCHWTDYESNPWLGCLFLLAKQLPTVDEKERERLLPSVMGLLGRAMVRLANYQLYHNSDSTTKRPGFTLQRVDGVRVPVLGHLRGPTPIVTVYGPDKNREMLEVDELVVPSLAKLVEEAPIPPEGVNYEHINQLQMVDDHFMHL
jgi:hypothetical protein